MTASHNAHLAAAPDNTSHAREDGFVTRPPSSQTAHDLETSPEQPSEKKDNAPEEGPEIVLVDWEGPDDPENPKKSVR